MRSSAETFGAEPADPLLVRSLADWLGRWPPGATVDVVGWHRRAEPAWDGRVRPAVGVASPQAMVLSVPTERVAAVSALLPAELLDPERLRTGLGEALGRPGHACVEWVFRWSTAPAVLPDRGVWVPAGDSRLPAWVRACGGEVLVARDGAGRDIGWVGIKRHTPLAHELAVVVAQRARGQGLGRRLVAQAARRILTGGAVPYYLHARVNAASGRLADAAGFPDAGWHLYELSEAPASLAGRWGHRWRAVLRGPG